MLKRHPSNPLIKPEMLKPSHPAYRVKGAFNAGAVEWNKETILLLRVAEDCIPKEGYAAVPYYSFKDGEGTPEILEVALDDPDVKLKDTRGVVYKGVDYLSTMSHIRLARSSDGINFKVDDKPFIYPCVESECFGCEDARATVIEGKVYLNYTAISGDGWVTALATTDDFKTIDRKG
ncbi:MAG: glycosidase, partial [Fibrobacterota bacterium]